MFQQVGNKVRDIINRYIGRTLLAQYPHRLAQVGSAIFQIGDWPADLSDDFLQEICNGLSRPSVGDSDGDAYDMLKRGCTRIEQMMLGIQREYSQDLAFT